MRYIGHIMRYSAFWVSLIMTSLPLSVQAADEEGQYFLHHNGELDGDAMDALRAERLIRLHIDGERVGAVEIIPDSFVADLRKGARREAEVLPAQPLPVINDTSPHNPVLVTEVRQQDEGILATAAMRACPAGEEHVLSCQFEGPKKEASICISGDTAIYRYGFPQTEPELTLTSSLMELGYLRKSGASFTIDEIVTFREGDFAYRFAAGFRDGQDPDPTALHKFGLLTVSQNDTTLTELTCRSETIEHVHDHLLARMREIGRERESDGSKLHNYDISYPQPAAQSPPCEKKNNVDTCWSRGISKARGGDLRSALEHFNMSCDAGIQMAGCYEAGKLYLHNRELRDYERAYDRFTQVCENRDISAGPYACKFLGWMHHTGIGARRDPEIALGYLVQACFMRRGDRIWTDAEGCHFLAENLMNSWAKIDSDPRFRSFATYAAYLALSMGCTEGAQGVCEDARALIDREQARSAKWIVGCDVELEDRSLNCASISEAHHEIRQAGHGQALREILHGLFPMALEGVLPP